MMNQLVVTIQGTAKSGKSNLANFIAQVARSHNIAVSINDLDGDSPQEPISYARTAWLRDNATITINMERVRKVASL